MASIEQLKDAISKIDEEGYLGGEDQLRSLAERAYQIAESEKGSLRVVAFIMYVIFSEHANAQSDGPVTLEQSTILWGIIQSPIKRGLRALSGDRNENIGGVVESLLNAYFASC